MDDPLFDPWSSEPGGPREPPTRSARWRSRPTAQPTPPPRTGESVDAIAEGGLEPPPEPTSVAELVRSVVTPRLTALSRRLRLARHETALRDQLDYGPGVLRFEVRPWPGPDEDATTPPSIVVEVGPDAAVEGTVVARYWASGDTGASESLSVPAQRLTATWVDRVTLAALGTGLRGV